jgi:transposase
MAIGMRTEAGQASKTGELIRSTPWHWIGCRCKSGRSTGMLHVDGYLQIRLLHWDGLSIRQIAKRLGHSRDSVKRALVRPTPLPYTRTAPAACPKLGLFIGPIEQILTEDQSAPRKQRHTAMRIFQRLRDEHGYLGQYDQVRRLVKSRRRKERDRTVRGRIRTIGQMFEEERRHALELPDHPFDACIGHIRQADKYQTVLFEDVRYSVPRHVVFEPVSALRVHRAEAGGGIRLRRRTRRCRTE